MLKKATKLKLKITYPDHMFVVFYMFHVFIAFPFHFYSVVHSTSSSITVITFLHILAL